jgi:hypothetical protein
MSVVIAAGFTGITHDLSHPRVGWRRLTGTVTGSTSAAGFAAANAATSRTDTFWRPTALNATWTVDFGSAQNVSYCGIASHTLGSSGCTVFFATWNGSTWDTVASTTPGDDGPILFLCGTRNVSQARITISGGATMPLVGVVFFGAVTEWPRKAVYAPSVSMQRAKVTEFSTNTTEGGQWAGRSVVRRYTTPKMQVDNLPESWIASEFDAFAAYAEREPFFIADKPGTYAASVAYAWATADLVPDRAIPNADVSNSVTLEMIGFRHG